METRIGRNNFALTVYVPYDCMNNCPFCTSKCLYEEKGVYPQGVEYEMNKVFGEYEFPIHDVVFTGGEPMADIPGLKKLIEIVPDGYDVYINTTLTRKDLWDFIELVNDDPKIKGVNISRHGTSFEIDAQNFRDIAEDQAVKWFEKPVRINVVLDQNRRKDYNDMRFVQGVLNRWESYDNVRIAFRADFREVKTEQDLHTPYETFPMLLFGIGLSFVRHSGCNVCDDLVFETSSGMVVSYHRGLESTSLEIVGTEGNYREINDLIIYPNGLLDYDWKDTNRQARDEIKLQFAAQKVPREESRWFTAGEYGIGDRYRYQGVGGCGYILVPSFEVCMGG